MSPSPSPAPPSCDDPELIASLREDLSAAYFTNDGVAELLGEDAVQALDREQVVPGQLRILELLEAGAPAGAVLTALWLVSIEVTPEQVDGALPQVRTDGLVRLGLAEITEADPEDHAITPRRGPSRPSGSARVPGAVSGPPLTCGRTRRSTGRRCMTCGCSAISPPTRSPGPCRTTTCSASGRPA
ncbi:hypothetical protein [Nesterenkonia pannonica]|uniref:DUF7059 domain-containing protein n=1 Tax=Nesterenkonia pannonica TaxID=1548602 RepID=UPI002164B880|nr:hypothetical protein [Nesterenkonia pannonica]